MIGDIGFERYDLRFVILFGHDECYKLGMKNFWFLGSVCEITG